MLQPRYKRILERLVEVAQRVYGDRLVSIVVFGSVGRGSARPDSDIDLLFVVRDLPRGRTKRLEEFSPIETALASEIALLERQGARTELSPLFKTPEEVEIGSLIFLDMTQDAVLLYDREGFMCDFLKRLASKLEKMKARRVFRGNAWFWDLGPDYKPEEMIKL